MSVARPFGSAGETDRSERRSLLMKIATCARERTGSDQRTLELLLQYPPKQDGSNTVIGPLILPFVPGLKQHEVTNAFCDLIGPLDAALLSELIAPDSVVARVRCPGIIALPPEVADSNLIGNPLLFSLWQTSMNLIVSVAWHNPAGAARRLYRAFSCPLSFPMQDWGMVHLLMRRLGIQWTIVPSGGSFTIGDVWHIVSDRDYGLLVTLFLTDSFGTTGCSIDRRILFGPVQHDAV